MPLSRISREYIAYMAILNSGFFVFQSYYIIFLTVNGLSYTDISLIFVGNFVALAILNLFAGDFADRHGRDYCTSSILAGRSSLSISASVPIKTHPRLAYI